LGIPFSSTSAREKYWWLLVVLVIGGLSMFMEEDAPEFKLKSLRIYAGLVSVFLMLFAAMCTRRFFLTPTTMVVNLFHDRKQLQFLRIQIEN
jgi:uncharacterized membrane protein YhaH (DUF805 family)